MILIKNASGGAEMRISGDIIEDDWQDIYDWYGIPATSPRSVQNTLSDLNGEPLTVWLNSYGGHVSAGSAIYTALKNYIGQVVIKIDGVAVSAASMIAMAGDQVKISPTAEIMIHKPWTRAEGNDEVMERTMQSLKSGEEALINAYQLKTGLERETLAEMMKREEWINAQKAVELHFADEILFDDEGLLAPPVAADARAIFASGALRISEDMKRAFEMHRNSNGQKPLAATVSTPEPPELSSPDEQQKIDRLRLEIELYAAI